MSRTAYHRAYYWSRISERRASARASRRKARERAAVIKIVCQAVDDARNEKPPVGGGLTRQGGCLTLDLRIKRDGSLNDCFSRVNHPTTLNARLIALVGETTRRANLNLHRGSQPVGTQRQRGSVKGNQSNLVKSSPQRVRLRKAHNKPARVSLGVLRLETVRVPQPKAHKF